MKTVVELNQIFWHTSVTSSNTKRQRLCARLILHLCALVRLPLRACDCFLLLLLLLLPLLFLRRLLLVFLFHYCCCCCCRAAGQKFPHTRKTSLVLVLDQRAPRNLKETLPRCRRRLLLRRRTCRCGDGIHFPSNAF